MILNSKNCAIGTVYINECCQSRTRSRKVGAEPGINSFVVFDPQYCFRGQAKQALQLQKVSFKMNTEIPYYLNDPCFQIHFDILNSKRQTVLDKQLTEASLQV
jgi:hypothetical protein